MITMVHMITKVYLLQKTMHSMTHAHLSENDVCVRVRALEHIGALNDKQDLHGTRRE